MNPNPIPMMSCEFAAVRLPALLALRPGRHSLPSPMTTTRPPAVASKKPAATCASSSRDDAEFRCNDDSGCGRLVDEGMAVLRRRIHEVEAAEHGWEEPPQDGQEWYATYDADVLQCQLLGVLQTLLIDSRPGVSVGIIAVVVFVVLVLAVPAFAFVLLKLLIDASRAIISNLHH